MTNSFWIQTFTGKAFDLVNIDSNKIDIRDVAHALSNLCRFGGHCKTFYSVAQHSILAANWIKHQGYDKNVIISALLHDASEAYLVDIPRPIKLMLPDYKILEEKIETAIKYKYKLPIAKHYAIKKIDDILLMTEKRDLMVKGEQDWSYGKGIVPLKNKIVPLISELAKFNFLKMAFELGIKY